MIALIRIAAVAFVVLTVLYVSLSFYSRARRKEKLALWWEEGGRQGDLDAYVRAGLAEYDRSLRRKLILAVYIVPTLFVAGIVYLVNYA